jgi:hypothetical protein
MKDEKIARFWDNFISKSKSHGIKDSAIRWHVKHAERYIEAHPEYCDQSIDMLGEE